ncbi:MAG TPA: 2-phosphosulfolactate phosphatase [Flexilinea sp.]|nr:2-phosphosulfolactate phosphatase [Flexilinea sp.]
MKEINRRNKTKFIRGTLEDCDQAGDLVVVIDVLRAFTTAAYAFSKGAKTIYCVAEVEKALELKSRIPGSLTMGEVNGFGIPEFDFNNSPAVLMKQDIKGKILIQRTTAGTQGLIRSSHAKTLVAASLVTAKTTAEFIRLLSPEEVFFVETGITSDGRGDEDTACADYIEGILTDNPIPEEQIIERVRNSVNGRRFIQNASPDLPAEDLEFVCDINRFHWIIQAERVDDQIVRLSKKEKFQWNFKNPS